MKALGRTRLLVVAAAFGAVLAFGVSSAISQNFHGIAFAKTCDDPTTVGSPLECRFQIFNFDTGNNSEVIFSLSDTVNAPGGAVGSGELLPTLELFFSGPTLPTCVGGSGSGTAGDPYVGATSCTLPVLGSTITTGNFTHYTVQAADYGLPNHRLTDQGSLGWRDNCDVDPGGCNRGDQTATAPGSSRVRFAPSLATSVNGNATSVIEVGGSAHDTATLTGMSPDAGGTVTYTLYTDNSCGSTAAGQPSPATVTVTNGSVPNSGSVTFSGPGRFWWAASYSGDANNLPASSGCAAEPLAVVDANIQITPATAVNPIGTNHTLIGHVNVNDGTGYTNAPDGTLISFEIISGPGSFVGAGSCTTTGGSGSCDVQITSPTPGLSTIRARTNVEVLGLSLHRETGDGQAGDSADAEKMWAAAKIEIEPDDTNEVGDPHTFTVTVSRDTGGGYQPATGSHVDFTLTNGNGADYSLDVLASTCDDPLVNVDGAGRCLIVINSDAPGTVTAHASAIVDIPGDGTVTVETDGMGDNSGDAVKTYVDAYIEITPPLDTNAVSTTHTFTAHVFINGGSGPAYTPAPDGTLVTFSYVGAHVGDFTGADSCLTSGGSCSVDTTSSTTGTDTMQASAMLSVNGVSMTRTTGQPAPGHANGPNAEKVWVDASIRITPQMAANAVGTEHVLTIEVRSHNGVLADGTATAAIESGPGSFVGSPSCDYVGGGTSASCTVTITSASTGTTVVSATSDVMVAGQSIQRTTDPDGSLAGPEGTDNAEKAWVDASIRITPQMAANAVGTEHVLTIEVRSHNGVLADGTATAAIESGPGSFVGSPSCDYVGGGTSASCTVTITSASTGTTVVSATSDVMVAGQSIQRTTDPDGSLAGPEGTDNAEKAWVDAWIEINPPMDTNAVNTNHLLTITVHALNGTLGDGTATASIVSGPGSFVGGANTCDYMGGGTSASCTVTITSAMTGTSKVHARSDIPVDGQSVSRATETDANTALCTTAGADPCDDALKAWVDAWIEINPPMDTNAVNTNHLLTVTVHALNGTLGDGTATASIIGGPGSFVGGVDACDYAGGGTSASCTVTITSTMTGTSKVHASSDIEVDGQSVSRATETAANTTLCTAAGADPCDDALKKWVDASIRITPQTAANAVGENHTFTITVLAHNGTLADGTATAHIESGPGSFPGPSDTATCDYTGGGSSASCTVTMTSDTTGLTVVSATSDIEVDGQTIHRTTDPDGSLAGPAGSANAEKRWVDAFIEIAPATATNAVGTEHVLTITVHAINGTLGDGTATATILAGSVGSFVGGVNACDYTGGGAMASCTVTITSDTPGTTFVQASSAISVDSQTITRTTGTATNDAAGGGTFPNAEKNWAKARITITPNDVNEINEPHTFTVTVERDTGAGYVPAPPLHVSYALTGEFGVTQTEDTATSTCDDAGNNIDASGQCTIVVNSSTPGRVTASAEADVPIDGATVHVMTDGTGDNSGPATKRWVDANIQVTPATANNPVSTNHTLTGHVNVNAGLGAGYVDASDGTVISFGIASGPGSFVGGTDQCTVSNGMGSCTVQITSAATGTTVVNASTMVSVGGVTLSRTTNGSAGNSGPAEKSWADDTVRTDIHDPAHTVITSANVGVVVHDKVFVERAAGTPASVPDPSGDVIFHRFDTMDCSGAPASNETVALAADGTAESSDFTVAGDISYQAEYLGDANYPAHTGACEPLSVQQPCPTALCSTYGKPQKLVMTYTGDFLPGTGTGSGNTQASGKVAVLAGGDPGHASPVRIKVTDNSNANASGASVFYDSGTATVNVGDNFTIDAMNGGRTRLPSQTFVHIFNASGTLLLSMTFHTSCSQPLNLNDTFITLKLVGYGGEGGTGTGVGFPATPPQPCELCDTVGKPKQLMMRYTTFAVDNTQAAGKVNPGTNTGGASPVRIRVTDNSDPSNTSKVYFDGLVNFGDTFLIDATRVGDTRLKAQTFVHIFSPSGALLSSGTFHTSCSQPLHLGDSFGNYTLVGFVGESGNGVGVTPPPPPSEASITGSTFHDKKLELEVRSVGADRQIQSISISWPASPNGKLQKVQLEGKTLWDTKSSSSAGLTISTFKGNVTDRTIQSGKTKTLAFEFEHNAGTTASGYSITVTFTDGSTVSFP